MASMTKSLCLEPPIHPQAAVSASKLGRYTEVGARTTIAESALGGYSYVVNDCDIIYARVGKFCSIASQTRINPGNHPMRRASQAHFTYRASTYFSGEADEEAFFATRRFASVVIGHDVRIEHGAIVLPGRAIGCGAVVASGAVVTKDVAPYEIVGGVPAKPPSAGLRPTSPRSWRRWPGGTGTMKDCARRCLTFARWRSSRSSKNTEADRAGDKVARLPAKLRVGSGPTAVLSLDRRRRTARTAVGVMRRLLRLVRNARPAQH